MVTRTPTNREVARLLVANRIAFPWAVTTLRYAIAAAGADPADYLGDSPFVTLLVPFTDHTLDGFFSANTRTQFELAEHCDDGTLRLRATMATGIGYQFKGYVARRFTPEGAAFAKLLTPLAKLPGELDALLQVMEAECLEKKALPPAERAPYQKNRHGTQGFASYRKFVRDAASRGDQVDAACSSGTHHLTELLQKHVSGMGPLCAVRVPAYMIGCPDVVPSFYPAFDEGEHAGTVGGAGSIAFLDDSRAALLQCGVDTSHLTHQMLVDAQFQVLNEEPMLLRNELERVCAERPWLASAPR